MRLQGEQEAESHARSYGQLILLAGNTPGLMRTEKADLKILVLAPGQCTSHHRHFVAESIFHVLEGALEFTVDGSVGTLRRGDTLIVEPGEFHCLRNVDASSQARVLEVESPPHDRSDKQVYGAETERTPCARPAGRFWRPGKDVRVKACGIANIDAAYVCDLIGIDAIGLHLVGRDRMARARAAERWLSALSHDLSVFILTDADEPSELLELARRTWCDTAQLQGNMPEATVARCADALRRDGFKVVKSVGLSDLGAAAIDYARAVSQHSDAVLLDASFRGGSGHVPDWALARSIVDRATVPVVLAGGLTPENVPSAIAAVRPFGVDVESGIEDHLVPRSGGRRVTVRSPDKLRRFLTATRAKGEP